MLYPRDAVHAMVNPMTALAVSVRLSTNMSEKITVARSLKGVQMADMIALVILTKIMLTRTTMTAREQMMSKEVKIHRRNRQLEGRRRRHALSVDPRGVHEQHGATGPREASSPVSLSGCNSCCMRIRRTASKTRAVMVSATTR